MTFKQRVRNLDYLPGDYAMTEWLTDSLTHTLTDVNWNFAQKSALWKLLGNKF